MIDSPQPPSPNATHLSYKEPSQYKEEDEKQTFVYKQNQIEF